MAERPEAPRGSDGGRLTHYWRVRKYLPERFGQRCRPLVYGRLNGVLVEFKDGARYVTNRYFIRKVAA